MTKKEKDCKTIIDDELLMNNNDQEISLDEAYEKDAFVEEQIIDNDGGNCPLKK